MKWPWQLADRDPTASACSIDSCGACAALTLLVLCSVHSYLLHLEVINLLLVMCSTQLHGSVSVVSSDAQLFIQAAMAQVCTPVFKNL